MKVLCNVDVTICKVQNSIILTLKVGKLGWIEYIDKDVCTALTYFGFHIEHKVAKYIQMFSKVYFFSTRSFFVGWSRKLKYTEQILQRYHRILADFSQILLTTTFFLLFFFGFFHFSIFFSFFCFLFEGVFFVCFFFRNKKYIFWYTFGYAGG